MELTWVMRGAVAGAAFLGGVFLLLPPTETKATWTNVHQAVPTRVYDPPVQPEPDQLASAALYAPSASQQTTYARPERWEDARSDRATAHEIEVAESDRAYGDGYAWASENEVEDRRECRRLDGPRADGCRDYVAGLGAGRDQDEREF